MEQSGVSRESKGNGTALKGTREPDNSMVRVETMAVSANGRRNSGTRGVKHRTGRWTESERQEVCQKSVKWVSNSSVVGTEGQGVEAGATEGA